MGKLTISMAMCNRYVSLPEGNYYGCGSKFGLPDWKINLKIILTGTSHSGATKNITKDCGFPITTCLTRHVGLSLSVVIIKIFKHDMILICQALDTSFCVFCHVAKQRQ